MWSVKKDLVSVQCRNHGSSDAIFSLAPECFNVIRTSFLIIKEELTVEETLQL